MSYKLEYPYTEEERANFIIEYNHNQGLLIEEVENIVEIPSSHYEPSYDEDGNFVEEVLVEDTIQKNMPTLYALEANEIMVDNKPVVDLNYDNKKAIEREIKFKKDFFYISPLVDENGVSVFKGGYFRKQPKGYSSAIESITTAYTFVQSLGYLPENTLTFYTAPDFADETQCTEEWLIANQFKNILLDKAQFNIFHINFITSWNNTEH